MSSPFSTWFRKGIDPGTIITLDQPPSSQWKTTQWKILEKLNERDFQVIRELYDDYGFDSFASTKLLCCNPGDHAKKAFMRIYLQVPYRKTEIDDADTRGRQATAFTSSELVTYQGLTQKRLSNTPKLLGYKTGTQDRSGPVPGGFVVWLVWEMVPGLRLGDGNGAGPFWALERYERDQVRVAFVNAFP
jgi:hypothetical protein